MKVLAGLFALVILSTLAYAVNFQPLTEPPECPIPEPGEVLNITFYPNEDDCNKYWECDNGNLYNGSCPDDLVWNPNEDACDWPYNYDCPYNRRSFVPLPSEEPHCPIPAPGEKLNVTFYPNVEDCTKFWECDNGNLINGSCPDGLIWNPNIDTCDWPYSYDCPYDRLSERVRYVGSSRAVPDCPVPEPGQVLNITFYPNDEDCTKYWECDNGNLYNGSCPDGLVWNPNVDSCDWPFNYECPVEEVEIAVRPGILESVDEIVCPPPSPSGHGNVTFFPNEENCHKFWECDNGKLIEGDCGDLVWNPIVDSCDWEYNYPCLAEPPIVTTKAPAVAGPEKPIISVLPAKRVVHRP